MAKHHLLYFIVMHVTLVSESLLEAFLFNFKIFKGAERGFQRLTFQKFLNGFCLFESTQARILAG